MYLSTSWDFVLIIYASSLWLDVLVSSFWFNFSISDISVLLIWFSSSDSDENVPLCSSNAIFEFDALNFDTRTLGGKGVEITSSTIDLNTVKPFVQSP